MKSILLSLLIVGFAWSAGDPAGFQYWSASELKGFSQSLGPKAMGGTPAVQQLTKFGNYSFMMAMRKGTGQSELHETQADIMVIESGEATMAYGGEMVGGKTTEPNEVRGTGISGGLERKLSAGDVLTIPAKTPHMMKVDPGKEIVYMTIKVAQ